jgi:membrane protein implicated in regulation of membrane protease activity
MTELANSTLWWIAAGVLVGIELLTGSFYLLMLALGLAASAIAAHLGLSAVAQWVIAALVGGGAAIAWHFKRPHATATLHAGNNRDVNLDVGETVQVDRWEANGSTTVKYRGSSWTALAAHANPAPSPGAHRIVEVRGSQLVIEKVSS